MKYMKRSNTYKANNVTFDPDTCSAYSYDWWKFVAKHNGKVIFNEYRYSVTTAKHQSKVRSLLRELGIQVDLVVKTRNGLQALHGVNGTQDLIKEAITEAIYNDDLERAKQIAKVLKFKLTQDFIQDVYNQKEIDLCDAYLDRALNYQRKKENEQTEKLRKELEDYLENNVCLRDYEIHPASKFGSVNKVAVHQVVDMDSMEHDVQNALYNFQRDGFGSICFYIGGK